MVLYGLFLLPKAVVENENQLTAEKKDSVASQADPTCWQRLRNFCTALQKKCVLRTRKLPKIEKKAIFADSLAKLYAKAGKFDSAGWYAEEAALRSLTMRKAGLKLVIVIIRLTPLLWMLKNKAILASKTQEFYGKCLK